MIDAIEAMQQGKASLEAVRQLAKLVGEKRRLRGACRDYHGPCRGHFYPRDENHKGQYTQGAAELQDTQRELQKTQTFDAFFGSRAERQIWVALGNSDQVRAGKVRPSLATAPLAAEPSGLALDAY